MLTVIVILVVLMLHFLDSAENESSHSQSLNDSFRRVNSTTRENLIMPGQIYVCVDNKPNVVLSEVQADSRIHIIDDLRDNSINNRILDLYGRYDAKSNRFCPVLN